MNFFIEKVVGAFWRGFDKHIGAATKKVLRGFRAELSLPALVKVLQFFRFGVAGIFNTGAYYLFYAIGIWIGFHYTGANVIGFIANVLSAFFWNYKFVFTAQEGEHVNKWFALIKTLVVYGFSNLVINNVMLYVWIDLLHFSSFVGPIINLFITVPFCFFVNKKWAYKGVKKKVEEGV